MIDAVALLGRDHERLVKRIRRVQRFGHFQQNGGFNAVDLVDRQRNFSITGAFFEAIENGLHALSQAARGFNQQHHHIGIRRAGPRRGDHRPVEPAFGPEQTGRVDEYQLALTLYRHTAKASGAWFAPYG